MKRFFRVCAAALAAASLLFSAALALTPEQLGTLLRENYPGDIPAEVWTEDTVDGMLRALGDGFTHYLSPEDYQRLLSSTNEEDPQAPSVTFRLEEGHIGAFTMPGFTTQTYSLVEKAMVENDQTVDRWIVDLRGNHGGELTSAADAMAAFVGGGELCYLRDKDGKVYVNRSDKKSLSIDPVILLVDGQTASAAELFAAAVRDSRAGLIIGGRTYGKGVAQSVFDKTTHPDYFADGDALLLTTYRFFSQGFNSNNVLGVIPQLMVDDALAPRVARLLCASAPAGDCSGYLRLHLIWRWYIDLQKAQADPEAFRALLEALPPQAELFRGTAAGEWQVVSPRSVAPEGYAPREFADVDGLAAKDAVNALKTYDILNGVDGVNYKPESTMNRATLCAMLAQAMNYPKSTNPPAFPDTPADAWYTPYITTLNAMGIVKGFEDGKFHPERTIPHQQFMAVLSRIAGYTNHRLNESLKAGPTEEALASGDYGAYDKWARAGAWAMDGWWQAPAKDIDPKAPTTREEAAVCLYNTLAGLGILPG